MPLWARYKMIGSVAVAPNPRMCVLNMFASSWVTRVCLPLPPWLNVLDNMSRHWRLGRSVPTCRDALTMCFSRAI
eukprot:1770371-Alexandrium_andersonii.AAC.1